MSGLRGSSVLELSSAWVVFRAWGVFCLGLCGASCCGFSEMSHAIPRHVFQTLKSHRWNCNVLGCCAKFGYPNCVRVLVDEAPEASSCVRSSSHDTVHNPRDASNTTPTPQNAKSPNTPQTPKKFRSAAASKPEKRKRPQGSRSNKKTDTHKLSVGFFGGARGIRTPDLFHAMEARYQLRHSPFI